MYLTLCKGCVTGASEHVCTSFYATHTEISSSGARGYVPSVPPLAMLLTSMLQGNAGLVWYGWKCLSQVNCLELLESYIVAPGVYCTE